MCLGLGLCLNLASLVLQREFAEGDKHGHQELAQFLLASPLEAQSIGHVPEQVSADWVRWGDYLLAAEAPVILGDDSAVTMVTSRSPFTNVRQIWRNSTGWEFSNDDDWLEVENDRPATIGLAEVPLLP